MEHLAKGPTGTSNKILIVDDEVAIASFLGDLLSSRGYATSIFTSSEMALEHCRTNLADYGLIISDICMPNLTGDQFAQQIHSINKNMPIVLCSGYCDHTSKQELLENGIYEYLEKPINSSKLLKIINELQLEQRIETY